MRKFTSGKHVLVTNVKFSNEGYNLDYVSLLLVINFNVHTCKSYTDRLGIIQWKNLARKTYYLNINKEEKLVKRIEGSLKIKVLTVANLIDETGRKQSIGRFLFNVDEYHTFK